MKYFNKLTNVIQDYPWGSKTSMTELFGFENPENKPMAEQWMGAHPKASSTIFSNGKQTPLRQIVEQNEVACLGEDTFKKFGELPFLFKVLAAEKALSIQVHPTKSEAEQGYAKENQLGIELNAFDRNYKDANHKPELVYALTPYIAMNGFREFEEISTLVQAVNIPALESEFNDYMSKPDSKGLKVLFERLLTLPEEQHIKAIEELLEWARGSRLPISDFILDLNEVYPGDIGLLSPLLLNVVQLEPGEAMFLNAGTPHAYVNGTALEIMANSDNVLRAGLTPKYIDVPELINSCIFSPLPVNSILTAPEVRGSELHFPVPVEDFAFSIFSQAVDASVVPNRAEIWFAIDSDATFEHQNGEVETIHKGESVFIPVCTGQFTVTCQGKVARAF